MARGWPLLRRAPARMLHTGSLAAMILISVGLLAGLVAAGPLFGSATGASGLARRLATIPDTQPASLRPVVQVRIRIGPPAQSEPRIQALVDAVPYLGNGQTSVAGDAWEFNADHPTPYIAFGGQRRTALLYFRTGALSALQILSGTRGAPGLWVPDSAAKDLGLHPGSMISVGNTYRQDIPGCGATFESRSKPAPADNQSAVRVAGIYRTAPDGRLPLGPYFSRISSQLPSDPGACPNTALLLIGDRRSVDAAMAAAHENPLWTYTAALTGRGQTPERLRQAAAGAQRLRLQGASPGTAVANLLTKHSGSFQIDSGLAGISRQADEDAAVAREQGRGIAYAGGVLGLVAVVVSLRALAARRRRETDLLLGLGTPTPVVVVAGILELLLPAVVGAAAGCAAACLAFSVVGPHPQLDPAAVRSAGLAAALVAVAALLCHALVTLGQARQVSRSLAGLPASGLGSQWLPLLTGATILAVVATLTRESGQSYRDPMAALLPILVLACGCSLVARAAAGVAAAVHRRRPDRPSPRGAELLVLRGLRRTGVAVSDLVIVLAIGVGVLASGLLSAALVQQSVTDKASVLAGARSSAHIPHSWLLGGGDGPAPRLPAGTTVVWRTSGVMTPDNQVYDILVVNPATLASAATWGTGRELSAARAALSSLGPPTVSRAKSRAPLPALLVGPGERKVGTTAQVQAGYVTQAVQIRRHLAAFPGAVGPTVVFDARSFFPRLDPNEDPSNQIPVAFDVQGDFATWVWTRDGMPVLRQSLLAHQIPLWETFTLDQARATPALTSSRWAAGYQVVLGLAAAALSGLALVVAVDRRVARAAAVDLVLKRFGFSPARLLALRTLELVGTCLGALAVLVLPLAVIVVLLPRLIEPDPESPPSMRVQVSALPLLISAAVAVVVTGAAAIAAARRSSSLDPGEVLRDDA